VTLEQRFHSLNDVAVLRSRFLRPTERRGLPPDPCPKPAGAIHAREKRRARRQDAPTSPKISGNSVERPMDVGRLLSGAQGRSENLCLRRAAAASTERSVLK